MNIITIFIPYPVWACSATKKKKQPNGEELCKLHSKLYVHGNPLTLNQ